MLTMQRMCILVFRFIERKTLNACKNILVVVQAMDRLITITVLRALYLEWDNPRCSVPVLHALI